MLYTKIKEDQTAALKAGDAKLLRVLKLLTSELSYAQVDFKGGELPDEEVTRVLMKEAKKRRDSIALYLNAGDSDRAEEEKYELEVIQSYMPAMMGEDDVEAEIARTADETGLRGGRLMGAVMGKLKGKVEGSVVQQIVNKKFPG